MQLLNREDRKILRKIQDHINHMLRTSNTTIEQIGTVDVYFHPSSSGLFLNCVTPHKGVAWVRREDLLAAFQGMERLGRSPRLIFQDALFPEAFRQQLEIIGLTLEGMQVVMIYRPLLGPLIPDEIPLGCLPAEPPAPVTAWIATERADLGTWLRVFNAGYFNTDMITVPPSAVDALEQEMQEGSRFFVLASYERAPLGAARVALHPPTAQIEALVTVPLWHGMGLEIGLAWQAVREAEARGCETVFTIAPPPDLRALYRRLGFEDLTHIMTFWQAETYAAPTDILPSLSDSAEGDDL